jgi:hypothetical protein
MGIRFGQGLSSDHVRPSRSRAFAITTSSWEPVPHNTRQKSGPVRSYYARLTPIRSSETNGHFNCLGTNPKNMAVEDDAAKERDVLPMRTILGCAALALAFSTATIPAQAKGCIKGALIGGTAGHFAGHHELPQAA